MSFTRTFWILASACLLATSAASQAAQPSAPIEDATVQRVRMALLHDLSDPLSAQIIITKGPWHGTINTESGPAFLPGTQTGDLICAQVNAKNAHGGYVGFKEYLIIFLDNGIVSRRYMGSALDAEDDVIKAACGGQSN